MTGISVLVRPVLLFLIFPTVSISNYTIAKRLIKMPGMDDWFLWICGELGFQNRKLALKCNTPSHGISWQRSDINVRVRPLLLKLYTTKDSAMLACLSRHPAMDLLSPRAYRNHLRDNLSTLSNPYLRLSESEEVVQGFMLVQPPDPPAPQITFTNDWRGNSSQARRLSSAQCRSFWMSQRPRSTRDTSSASVPRCLSTSSHLGTSTRLAVSRPSLIAACAQFANATPARLACWLNHCRQL